MAKSHSRRYTRKRGGYNSGWSYVSSVFGDLPTQTLNSLVEQPGQDIVARHSTQSVPIGMPNANVKGVIANMAGGRRRGLCTCRTNPSRCQCGCEMCMKKRSRSHRRSSRRRTRRHRRR